MQLVLVFLCGLLFGTGLVVSELYDPETILRFVDFGGDWDPRLLAAMVGAASVYFVADRVARRRQRPLFAPRFSLPTRHDLDWRLIVGSSVFGIGWGTTGICPGPSLVRLGAGAADSLYTVPAILVGFASFELWERLRARSREPMGYPAAE